MSPKTIIRRAIACSRDEDDREPWMKLLTALENMEEAAVADGKSKSFEWRLFDEKDGKLLFALEFACEPGKEAYAVEPDEDVHQQLMMLQERTLN
jgi:hypothetical protein